MAGSAKAQVSFGAVDSLAGRVVAHNLTPALGVAVVMDGQTILAKSYGVADVTNRVPADANTLWYIASTSKSLTGFGVSLLAAIISCATLSGVLKNGAFTYRPTVYIVGPNTRPARMSDRSASCSVFRAG